MAPESRQRVVLLVAYFFPPIGGGGVQRTVKFVKHLRPLGWRSEVVTVNARDYWVCDSTLAGDVPADTSIHRTVAPTGLTLLGFAGRGRRQTPASSGAGAPVTPRSSRLFGWLRALSSFFLIQSSAAAFFSSPQG